MLLKNFRIFQGAGLYLSLFLCLCVRLGKHLDVWAASASVAWASEPAKNTQVEKIKFSRRCLYTAEKENKIFLIYNDIQMGSPEEGLPNTWGNAQIFPHI
jgi:hypothetical protein